MKFSQLSLLVHTTSVSEHRRIRHSDRFASVMLGGVLIASRTQTSSETRRCVENYCRLWLILRTSEASHRLIISSDSFFTKSCTSHFVHPFIGPINFVQLLAHTLITCNAINDSAPKLRRLKILVSLASHPNNSVSDFLSTASHSTQPHRYILPIK
jgi:hypothetical protein